LLEQQKEKQLILKKAIERVHVEACRRQNSQNFQGGNLVSLPKNTKR